MKLSKPVIGSIVAVILFFCCNSEELLFCELSGKNYCNMFTEIFRESIVCTLLHLTQSLHSSQPNSSCHLKYRLPKRRKQLGRNGTKRLFWLTSLAYFCHSCCTAKWMLYATDSTLGISLRQSVVFSRKFLDSSRSTSCGGKCVFGLVIIQNLKEIATESFGDGRQYLLRLQRVWRWDARLCLSRTLNPFRKLWAQTLCGAQAPI